MKIQKGYVISLILYVLLIIIFRLTSDKFDKKFQKIDNNINNINNDIKNINNKIDKTTQKIDIVNNKLKTDSYIRLKNGDDEQNAVVAYLWNKTHNIDIILTFYGESWLQAKTINNNKLKDGTIWSRDFGYCQLNDKYHNEYINSKDFKDMNKQLDYCIEVYNKAIKSGRIKTTFYAYNYRYSKRIRSQFVISQEAVDITYQK